MFVIFCVITTVIGLKTHDIELFVNTVHMGYRLLKFQSMKLGGFVVTNA